MMTTRLSTIYVASICALSAQLANAADSGADMHRLQQQREQQQTELRLKMQQQQDRALRPPQNPGADLQRRQLERTQIERQIQLHDRQSRAGIAPQPAVSEAKEKADQAQESERAARSSAQQLRGFDAERYLESERVVRPGLPPVDY